MQTQMTMTAAVTRWAAVDGRGSAGIEATCLCIAAEQQKCAAIVSAHERSCIHNYCMSHAGDMQQRQHGLCRIADI
jgi:hypothetical protein